MATVEEKYLKAQDSTEDALFDVDVMEDKDNGFSSSSSYLLTAESQFSRNIDHWMNGETPSTVTPASPPGKEYHSTPNNRTFPPVTTSSFDSGLWCILAMIFPLFSMTNCPWRCSSRLLLQSAGIMMNQISKACRALKARFRQFSEESVAREVFATALDIVLVIYAVGFLILTLYQASLFT